MTKSTPPGRTEAQRIAALHRANSIRAIRSTTIKRIKNRTITAAAVIANPHPDLLNMKLWTVILAMPQYGETKAHKLFVQYLLPRSKTLGGLTVRQRAELVRVLGEDGADTGPLYVPRQPDSKRLRISPKGKLVALVMVNADGTKQKVGVANIVIINGEVVAEIQPPQTSSHSLPPIDSRKNHPFAPTYPGSTKCIWCMFAPKAHPDYKEDSNVQG